MEMGVMGVIKKPRVIFLADCESFYASVEKVAHPEFKDKPVAVGDPERRSGIILAACPIAKSRGVTTAERVGEALAKCPELVVIRPRMQEYMRVSLFITSIYRSFTDLVEPYSVDEQFIDLTGSQNLFGTPVDIAKRMQEKVMQQTGVNIRVGISSTKVLAKTACDNFAKKVPGGIFELPKEIIQDVLWPLPINKMFMVASRMTAHFMSMGIYTIGDLAQRDLFKFKQQMRTKFGKNSDIQAEFYWNIANGLDNSLVSPKIKVEQESIGAGRALQSHKYAKAWQVYVIMLELCSIACRRARQSGVYGSVVSLSCSTSNLNYHSGFHRQMKMQRPTNLDDELFMAAKHIFDTNWNGQPVGRISVDMSGLIDDDIYQLDLFEDRDKKIKMLKVMDDIKDRFGEASILRASSLTAAGQARERATMIGGHFK
jgi:nucleotidyltransferase/DNA polymerase involved in DNA repair